MPSTFKYITDDKIQSVQNRIYEAVPLTGTIISGTYADANVRNYSHDRFQSVYDYPVLSSSANHIFDIAFGYCSGSNLSSSANLLNAEKVLNYTQFAQIFQGFDITGTIQLFDQDGNVNDGGTKLKECVFIFFSRTVVKDGIKRGSFSATFFTGGTWAAPAGRLEINDSHAATTYFVNSPVGEWSYLTGNPATAGGPGTQCGLIFYGPGLIVLTGSIFTSSSGGGTPVFFSSAADPNRTFNQCMTASTLSASANGLRRKIVNMSFVNTTELNSQLFFIDIGPNEFNYSSNPTYLSASKIRTKDDPTDNSVAYITEVGLYSADNELLASGKFSEPIKKTVGQPLTVRARVDY